MEEIIFPFSNCVVSQIGTQNVHTRCPLMRFEHFGLIQDFVWLRKNFRKKNYFFRKILKILKNNFFLIFPKKLFYLKITQINEEHYTFYFVNNVFFTQ